MSRFFNTAGPCDPLRHYMLPPEQRMPDLLRLVKREPFFVVHAPRQTGKTTAMLAVATRLLAHGYLAVCATLENSAGAASVAVAEALWRQNLHFAASQIPGASPPPVGVSPDPGGEGGRLLGWIQAWAAREERPIVLLLDETDAVSGPALFSLLRQLRAGYFMRGVGRFPVSVGLIGMRDLRDDVPDLRQGAATLAVSPFNISVGSFTVRNFLPEAVAALLGQPTLETGQAFSTQAVDALVAETGGQPFLVNAIALDCMDNSPGERIEPTPVMAARERLLRSRSTHLDVLSPRLREPRVAKVIEAVLLGDVPIDTESDYFVYVVDLGLVAARVMPPAIANPIYREMLTRALSASGR